MILFEFKAIPGRDGLALDKTVRSSTMRPRIEEAGQSRYVVLLKNTVIE